jgi:hypothetical protein
MINIKEAREHSFPSGTSDHQHLAWGGGVSSSCVDGRSSTHRLLSSPGLAFLILIFQQTYPIHQQGNGKESDFTRGSQHMLFKGHFVSYFPNSPASGSN